MGKRPAASASAAAKAKKAVKVDPVEEKCSKVAAALKEVESEAVGTLFGDVIPLSLGLCQEERHSYQQGVVDMVGKELEKQEAALETAITEAEGELKQVDTDKEKAEGQLVDLEATSQQKVAQAQEKKYALADCALAFRGAKEGLAEAEAKQTAGEKELSEVAKKHEALAKAISEILEPLKEGTMDKERVPQAAVDLVPTLQCYFQVEESLVPAIPAVLSKEPSARGSFDTMAATQLEEQAKKALANFATTIKGGEAAKAERTAAVEEASEALTAARNAQRVSAGVFTAAQAEEESAQAAVAEAKKGLRAFGPAKKSKAKALANAQIALQGFRDGPLAAFKELGTRSNQPKEEPAVAEEAAEEVAAEPAEAEAAPEAADAEMPAAA